MRINALPVSFFPFCFFKNSFMKHFFFICCGIILFFSLFLAGCQKLVDGLLRRHADNPTTCKISSISYQLYDYTPSNAVFYNNRVGDPDSVIFTSQPTYGTAKFFYFKYDQQLRLVAFNAYNDRNPENYFFTHTYVYSDKGILIADTARISQDGVRQTFKFEIQYDSKGRVISETGHLLHSNRVPEPITEPFILLYNYNAEGNINDVNRTYDTSSINFLRTSSILMFTERNYSKNNPSNISGINDQGLPLGFPGIYHNEFLSNPWGLLQRTPPSQIKYDCTK